MRSPAIPSIDHLLVLLVVAEAGSFSAAAKRLGRATSAISYAIDTLEAQLGLSLFDRGTTRKPKLTQQGEAIVSEAKAVAHSVETLRARVLGFLDELEPEVQILDQHPLSLDDNIVWTHDRRIKAVVSAAPALGFAFDSNGLAEVRQPLQLWRGEYDQMLPHPYYAEAVRLALPNPPETHVVADAGHYDFLPPCSAKLATHVPAICTSKPGFDRAAFHERFDHDIVAFFTRTLR